MRLRFADARAWRYAMSAIGKIIDSKNKADSSMLVKNEGFFN